MKCSICGTPRLPGTDRCPTCGCRFRDEYIRPFETRERPRRKSSGIGCCLVVLAVVLGAILAAVFVLSRLYVDFDREYTTRPERVPESAPWESRETTPAIQIEPTLPAVSEDCFAIAEGALMFLPDRYDGSPVLQVPETVGGQTVTAIGPGCFADCEMLTTIVLPDTVTSIGSRAFAGCRNLRGLLVPDGTEVIGKEAFVGCLSLESVYIPGSMDTIAPGCFDDCAALLYIFYEGFYAEWDALYSDYINPFTGVFCLDGEYYHGAD